MRSYYKSFKVLHTFIVVLPNQINAFTALILFFAKFPFIYLEFTTSMKTNV